MKVQYRCYPNWRGFDGDGVAAMHEGAMAAAAVHGWTVQKITVENRIGGDPGSRDYAVDYSVVFFTE